MPVKNKRSNNRGNKSQKSQPMSKAGASVPMRCVPPPDPPTIRMSSVKVTKLYYETSLTAGAAYKLTFATILKVLRATCYSSTTAALHFQIIKVWAYGEPGAANIAVRDTHTNFLVLDSGSASIRPRAGIEYPPVLQTIYPSGTVPAVGPIEVASDNDESAVILFITVRHWPDIALAA